MTRNKLMKLDLGVRGNSMSKNIVRFVFFISFMLLFFFSTLHLFLIFYKQTISENVLLVMILFFTFIHYNFGMFVKKEFKRE